MNRLIAFAVAMLAIGAANGSAAVIYSTGFEAPAYTAGGPGIGDLNGQQGWVTDVGPTSSIRIRDDLPRVGAQSLWGAAGASGGVPAGTRGARDLSADLAGRILTINSRVILSTGQRSVWEFNSVFGTAGLLGGVRVLANGEYAIETAFGTTSTGVSASGFPVIELMFDFDTGLASVSRNGLLLLDGVAFDASNSMITQVAAMTVVTPGRDAAIVDNFNVIATPEPSGIALFGIGAAALLLRRRRSRQ